VLELSVAGSPASARAGSRAALDGGSAGSTACLLQMAAEAAPAEFGTGDWRTAVTRDLIACAAELVALFPDRDLHAAQEVLSTIRAAISTATYAVRKLHEARMEIG
jgi:hypothetical protein